MWGQDSDSGGQGTCVCHTSPGDEAGPRSIQGAKSASRSQGSMGLGTASL